MTWQQCKTPFSHSISRLLSFWPPVLPPMVDKSSVFWTRATVIHSLRPRVSDRWKGNCEENPISISHPMDPITIHTQLTTPARTTTTTHNYVGALKCSLIRSFVYSAAILVVVFGPHHMVRRIQERCQVVVVIQVLIPLDIIGSRVVAWIT